MGYRDAKGVFQGLFPGFREAVGKGDTEIDELFEESRGVMGEQGVKRKFTWPCALVLATRR